MRIQTWTLQPYSIPMTSGRMRSGVIIHLVDEAGRQGKGEISPLPQFSKETLDQCLAQLEEKLPAFLDLDWKLNNFLAQLTALNLYPAVSFGLESALLAIIDPLSDVEVETAALLMGPSEQILELAHQRYAEGFTVAKLKVGHLDLKEAKELIDYLLKLFKLRIDVNRAWTVETALRFFSDYAFDTFDYVEEPFDSPHQLQVFNHPLAVDESFPNNLSFNDLECLPTLKAIVYKPTIHGGLVNLFSLKEWADRQGIQVVLSSSFETPIGLSHIASIAKRLSLKSPLGIGTLPFLCGDLSSFSNSN